MENSIDPLHGCIEYVSVQDISPNVINPDAGVFERIFQILLAAAGKIIINDNFTDVLLQELVNGVRTDQAAAADHH